VRPRWARPLSGGQRGPLRWCTEIWYMTGRIKHNIQQELGKKIRFHMAVVGAVSKRGGLKGGKSDIRIWITQVMNCREGFHHSSCQQPTDTAKSPNYCGPLPRTLLFSLFLPLDARFNNSTSLKVTSFTFSLRYFNLLTLHGWLPWPQCRATIFTMRSYDLPSFKFSELKDFTRHVHQS
jgi:hypothetical protein